jgi:hypothetical protein
MTTSRQRVVDALLQAVDEVNSILPDGQKLARVATLALHGPGSALDSIALINLLVAAEDKVAAATGRTVALTTLVAETDPARYRTLEGLADLTLAALELEP